MSPEIMI